MNKYTSKKDIFGYLSNKDFRLKIFLEGIFVGLCVGLVISAFRFVLERVESFRDYSYGITQISGIVDVSIRLLVLVLIAMVINSIMKSVPQTAGSGIVQVKGLLSGQIKSRWLRNLIGKFLGTVLSIGAGLSLGRQGPSVQIGASIGQGISRLLGRLRIEEKYLVTSGAAAGLAAAFNAPLAGVIFALEELHKNFSPTVLMSAIGSSLAADFVMRQFFGSKPIIDFTGLAILPQKYYIFLIGLGIICGFVGVVYNRLLVLSIKTFKTVGNTFPSIKSGLIIIPLFLAGFLGYFYPQVLGGGEKFITSLSTQDYALTFLLILLIIKFVFTMISAGSGAPGGIFLPMLVIGALLGDIYGNILGSYYGASSEYVLNYVVFAMAAVFTAVVKAPVTGSILLTEMTGSFGHLLPVILVCMVAYVVSDISKTKSVYESIYHLSAGAFVSNDNNSGTDIKQESQLKTGGKDYKGQRIGTKIILEEVVRMNSRLDGQKIKNIEWPQGCLIVSIRRGEEEIIPRGNTRIHSGDFLCFLVDQGKECEFVEFIANLCEENCPKESEN